MNIRNNKLLNTITTQYNQIRKEIEKSERHRYFRYDNVTTPEIYNQLDVMSKCIANYAKAKGIKVGAFDVTSPDSPRISLFVSVRTKDGKYTVKDVNSDLDAVNEVKRVKHKLKEDCDGLTYVEKTVESHQDNFVRNIYRTISTLEDSLNEK